MKRIPFILILIFLLSTLPALAERTIYADQDGVRVFSEDGKVGLMGADGTILADAIYDCIEPFNGIDYTVVHQGHRSGLMRRDGSLIAECIWSYVDINHDWMQARMYDYDFIENDIHSNAQLIDLMTCDILFSGYMEFTYFSDALCLEEQVVPTSAPRPFHTRVYNKDMTLRFETDYDIGDASETYFTAAYALIDFGGIPDTILDHDGNVVMTGLNWCSVTGTGAVRYSRMIENPLRKMLETLGYSYNRIGKALMRRLDIDKPTAVELLRFLEDREMAGVLMPDGQRVEAEGYGLYESGATGLWELWYKDKEANESRYIYVNEAGEQAFQGVYKSADDFINGTAIVSEDGETYYLINTDGQRASEIEWIISDEYDPALALQSLVSVIVIEEESEIRIIDHNGEYITEERFSRTRGGYNGATRQYGILILTDQQGRNVLMDEDGQILCRVDGEEFYIEAIIDNVAAVGVGDKEGLLRIRGENAGQWVKGPAYGHFLPKYDNAQQYFNCIISRHEEHLIAPDGTVLCPCYYYEQIE